MNYVLTEEEFKNYIHKDRLRQPLAEAHFAIGAVCGKCVKDQRAQESGIFDVSESKLQSRAVLSPEMRKIMEVLETLRVKLDL